MRDNAHPSNNQKVFHKNDELLGGRYIIEEQLGCLTYKAKNTTLDTYFILRFKDVNESDEEFNTSTQILMNFKGHDSVAHGIMKWNDINDSGEKLSFVVQKYLEGAISLDTYFRQEGSVRSRRIKLIEVAIVLSGLYEIMHEHSWIFEIQKSNIFIQDEQIKINGFKKPSFEQPNTIHYILNLVNDILPDLQVNEFSNFPSAGRAKISDDLETEISNELKELVDINFVENLSGFREKLRTTTLKIDKFIDHNSSSEFEDYIQDFFSEFKKDRSSNSDFQELRNRLKQIKITEEKLIRKAPDKLIKESVKSFEEFIDDLVKEEGLIQAWPIEDRVFYATLLFKSVADEDQFTKIYFGKYKKAILYSFSNWDKDYDFLAREQLLISNSCAGFPIIWYDKNSRKELEGETRIEFQLNKNEQNIEFIEYVIAKDVKGAIKSRTGIIANRYQKAGWRLITKDGSRDGEVSDDIDYMITIPIYQTNSIGTEKESIIAVVHFELIQNLTLSKAKEIAKCLSLLVYNKFTSVASLFNLICELAQYENS
jgi:hypothetical protein